MEGESELQTIQRHVRGGAAAVLRQKGVVAELERNGRDAATARALLAAFEDVQREHLAHLARIVERDGGEP